MKKNQLRTRKVDHKRCVQVFRLHEIPDLEEANNAVQRSVAAVETGVEKDEESEHHLQAVISAKQAALTSNAKVADVYVPTRGFDLVPDEEYQALPLQPFRLPVSYIKSSQTVEDLCGCPYSLDEIDGNWLNNWNAKCQNGSAISRDALEEALYWIEVMPRSSEYELPTWDHFVIKMDSPVKYHKAKWPENIREPEAIRAIFEHWSSRAKEYLDCHVMPTLKTVETWSNDDDPFVCFRRRDVKPMRKTRRSEAQCLERLRKLQTELELAKQLAEMTDKRERMNRESLCLNKAAFLQKCVLRETKRKLGLTTEPEGMFHFVRKRKEPPIPKVVIPLSKLKRGSANSSASSALAYASGGGVAFEERMINAAEALQRKLENELQKRKLQDSGWEDVTEQSFFPFPNKTPDALFHTPSKASSTGSVFRRRVGRFGRVFIDQRPVRNPEEPVPEKFKYDQDWFGWQEPGIVEVDEWQPHHLLTRTRFWTNADSSKFYRSSSSKKPMTERGDSNPPSGRNERFKQQQQQQQHGSDDKAPSTPHAVLLSPPMNVVSSQGT